MQDGATALFDGDLGPEEWVLINNALNEIVNGPSAIPRAHFEARTGVPLETAQRLLSRMSEAFDRHALIDLLS